MEKEKKLLCRIVSAHTVKRLNFNHSEKVFICGRDSIYL